MGRGNDGDPRPARSRCRDALRPARQAHHNQRNSSLARTHGATVGCPITTGIFAWIAAHAAKEAAAEGKKKTTPYWRTLKTGGELNAKYPGGVAALKKLLEAEGHNVIPKGKRWLVEGYADKLASGFE